MGRNEIEGRKTGVAAARAGLLGLLLAITLLVPALFALAPAASADITFGPQGSGAGQLSNPQRIAVDYATGEVFVTEGINNGVGNARISVFDSDGDFLRAFGWGVDTGAAALEVCTTASSCQQGIAGSGAGQLTGFRQAIAVDNDPLSPSYHDVFVVSSNRVQRFTPGGAFVLAFGDGVNQTTGGDVCTAASGNTCKAGVSGFGPGQIEGGGGSSFEVALAAGKVHVADCTNCGSTDPGASHRVQTFSSSGALLGQPLTVSGLEAGRPQGLAVDSAGNFYLSTSGAIGVRKYDSAGSPLGLIGSGSQQPLALDSADNLYVLRRVTPTSVSLYDPAGTPLSVTYGEEPRDMEAIAARSTPDGDFYVITGSNAADRIAHIKFEPPGPAVLPRAAQVGASQFELNNSDTKATPVGNLTATFNTQVNPEGESTTVHFEYISDEDFKAAGETFGLGTVTTPESAPIGSDFEPHAATFDVTCSGPGQPGCLLPDTVYHLRAVATNVDGEDTGTEATFETQPPIVLGDAWSTDVGFESARLHARLDPNGIPATARFEYVEQASFEASGFAGATLTPELDFGAGDAMTSRSALLGSLAPGTTYRYRYLATDFYGSFEGPVRSFTTFSTALPPKADCPNQAFRVGASATLPDCRAYELVSPLEKGNGDVVPGGEGGAQGVPTEQAAGGGDALAYAASRSFGDAVSSPIFSQYLARRDPATGWSSNSLNPPLSGGNLYQGVYQRATYKGFSEDLCSGWLNQNSEFALAPGTPAGVPNLYRRRNCGGDAYELLTTAAPPGFGREGEEGTNGSAGDTGSKYYPGVGGWSEDGTLSAFKAPAALTPQASTVGVGKTLTCEPGESFGTATSIAYQWLRNGAPIAGKTADTYETADADKGKAIQCRVKATNGENDKGSGGKVGSVGVSNPAQIVAPAPATMPPLAPAFIPAPETDALLTVGGPGGQTLSCDPREAGWSGSPTSFSYEWYRNGGPPASGTGAIASGSKTVNSVVTASGSGTLASGSKEVIGVTSTTGPFAAGQTITGTGIPAGTTIAAIGPGTLELSQAATASGSQSLTAGPQPFAVGWTISGTGIPAGTTIAAISGQTLTLSANATLTLGKVPLSAIPTTPTYAVDAADLARAAAFQCAVTATNAGGSVTMLSANLTTTGPAPEPKAPRTRAFVLDVYRVYAQREGELALVSVLPSGEAAHTHAAVGTRAFDGTSDGNATDSVVGAVSADGSRIFFSVTTAEPPEPVRHNVAPFVPRGSLGASRLYLRVNPMAEQSAVEEVGEEEFHCSEAGKACTVALSDGLASFVAADPEAGTALLNEGDDLYEVDIGKAIAYEAGARTQIATDVLGVMGASKDLSRVYLASEALCSGAATNSEDEAAQAGDPNLYLYEPGESCAAGEFTFVAGLHGGDVNVDGGTLPTDAGLSVIDPEPFRRHSRVSGDGLHAAFVSRAQLSEYDNTDTAGGEPAAEVFLYDAAEGKLRCTSCNPSGERPRGRNVSGSQTQIWVAAQIPGWATQWHPSRVLSEDGSRLFFESFEALVPRDSNGRQDVYEWQEAHGMGECEAAGAERYVPSSEGCLSLISSGTNALDSEFLDASASGSDVFFRTASSLVGADYGLVDIYDARVEGGFPPEEPPAPTCEGEACQGAPSPPNDPTPASATFQGAGNVTDGAVRPKPRPCAKGKVRRKGRCVATKRHKRAKHHRQAKSGRRAHR